MGFTLFLVTSVKCSDHIHSITPTDPLFCPTSLPSMFMSAKTFW